MSSRLEFSIMNGCRLAVFVFLFAACITLFVLHSLYFIFRYAEDSQKEFVNKNRDQKQVYVPAVIICNRMPFSQDGINSINTNLRNEAAIRYLREWTNPSMRDSADYPLERNVELVEGGQIVQQYLPPFNRNGSLNDMQYQCQSVINSCSYQGVQLSSFDCCRNIVYRIPTTNGLCWAFQDKTMWQNSTSPLKQFTITFQISQNSWYNPSTTVHPGIDIYLRENADDPMRLASDLQDPITLRDKQATRLRMHKEKKAFIRHNSCGQTIGDAASHDRNALHNNDTNLLACYAMVSMYYCGCHPLQMEMLPYDSYRLPVFGRRVNTTEVCSVDQYNLCSRRYIDFARPQYYDEPIPNDLRGGEYMENCRNSNKKPCLLVSYPGAVDTYDMPADYRSSPDYVSRLVLEYDTMLVTEILVGQDPNLYEMLSFVGYNLALWFCVAHIIWSVFYYCTKSFTPDNKVSPVTRMSISHPIAPLPPPVEIVPRHEEPPSTSEAEVA